MNLWELRCRCGALRLVRLGGHRPLGELAERPYGQLSDGQKRRLSEDEPHRTNPMQASWNGTVIARSDDIVTVEGNAYFPPDALVEGCFQPSSHRSVCGWKGEAHYYNVVVNGQVNANAAWFYPDPSSAAAEIKGRVAFWKGVQISQA